MYKCEAKTTLYSEANHVESGSEAGIEDSGVYSADGGSGLRGAAGAVWARASRMTCAISSWADNAGNAAWCVICFCWWNRRKLGLRLLAELCEGDGTGPSMFW